VTRAAGETATGSAGRIPLTAILDRFEASPEARGLVAVYRFEVLPVKTRTLRLVGQKTAATIVHTLLGYEVKARFKRIQCPDLVTARYLKLFSELGCHSIRLPYDPTVTARILPELEAALQRIEAGVRELFPDSAALRRYVTRRLYALLRRRLR
jgi:hypothetical protein